MGITIQQGLTSSGGGPTLLTEQATTSGTTKDFTIPAGAKRVTVMINGVSLTSAAAPLGIQLGDSGGIEATGYVSTSQTSGTATASTTQFNVLLFGSSAHVADGRMVLSRVNATHTWVASGAVTANSVVHVSAGVKTTSAELTTVRLMGGTFDAGSVNVMWE